MSKGKASGMTPLRVRDVRRYLEARGYTAEAGKHKHLKLRCPGRPPVLLPLQPQMGLSLPAARQIAQALGLANAAELVAAVQHSTASPARAARLPEP
jgi:predicted RNA binding protein YcfA (HicA-like mRNA interferase family)